jgi:hypothetical protein
MRVGQPVTAALLASAFLSLACRRKTEPPPATVASAPAPSRPAVPAAPDGAALAADYDPTVLVEQGAEPVKVYLAEPRNAAWAGAVEDVVGRQLGADVKKVAGSGGVSMGCRTLSCLILVDAPADKMEAALAMVQMVALGPITVNLGATPEGRGQVLFLTERRMADAAAFTGWYQRTRRALLDAVKDHSKPNPLPIPVLDLPE